MARSALPSLLEALRLPMSWCFHCLTGLSLSRLDHKQIATDQWHSMDWFWQGKIETVENMVKLPPTLKFIGSAAFNVPFVQFFVYSEIIIYLCASDAFLVTNLPIQAEAPPSSLLSYSKKHPEWCVLRDPNFGQPLISWVYIVFLYSHSFWLLCSGFLALYFQTPCLGGWITRIGWIQILAGPFIGWFTILSEFHPLVNHRFP